MPLLHLALIESRRTSYNRKNIFEKKILTSLLGAPGPGGECESAGNTILSISPAELSDNTQNTIQ